MQWARLLKDLSWGDWVDRWVPLHFPGATGSGPGSFAQDTISSQKSNVFAAAFSWDFDIMWLEMSVVRCLAGACRVALTLGISLLSSPSLFPDRFGYHHLPHTSTHAPP